MSLSQQITEFRFNLETLDLLNNMGKSSDYSIQMLSELGLNSSLIKFMQTNRMLLNSVLLRLQLYSEQNMIEQKIRSSLAVLTNPSVNTLLDYFYKASSEVEVKETKKPSSPPPQKVEEVEEVEEVEGVEEVEEVEDNHNDDESHFDSFFTSCIRVSDDATHIVKMSAMYDAFSKWWSNNYEDETPSKDELKEYLSEKLGHPIKSNVSNVSLI
jgi:hypothetical protein